MEFPALVTISRDLYAMTRVGEAGAGALSQLMGLQGGGNLPVPNVAAMLAHTLDLTVAHEVAHQYFACLVGSDPVADPIADEPLAQHVALLALEWTRGREVADAVREGQLRAGYQFYRMTGGADGAAARPTGAFANELEYGALVYSKAPFLHDEERRLLGDAAHLAGLRAYVERYRYRWACADCLSELYVAQNPRHATALRQLRKRWRSDAAGDEDLGKMDLSALVRGAGGGALSPETLELLQELLQSAAP